jgi:DNA-binding transcriptional LysR family regulator
MWSSVELREIRMFLVLAQELSFARTAEQLRLTTSRVSQVVRDLERKLSEPLLYRTSRRVELTAFGQRFRQEVGEAYEQLVEALQQLDAVSRANQSTLRLGLFSDPRVSWILEIVKTFEQRHPQCRVQAAEVPVDDPFGPLHRGEFDLVASWLPHGQAGLVTGPILSSEPRVLVVSADHPLAGREQISIEDVADYLVTHWDGMPREFHEVWIPSRTPAGRAIERQRFSDQTIGDRGRMTSELLYLVTTGRVVHPTVPSFANMFSNPDIVYVPISDLPPLRSALVWPKRNTTPLLGEFVEVAREVASPDDSAGRSDSRDGGQPLNAIDIVKDPYEMS